jgi:uracil-DNA glycosylase family 4
MKRIPNEPPRRDSSKIAVIGYSPSLADSDFGRPFVDHSGNILEACLRQCGLSRDVVYLGNLVPFAGVRLSDTFECELGAESLREDLTKHNINIVVLLGSTVFKHTKLEHSLEDFRGTIFTPQDTSSPFYGHKCIATYHPSDIIRQWAWWPYLVFDLQKAKTNCLVPDFTPPVRNLQIECTSDEIITYLNNIRSGEVALDIEGGGPEGISCISFSQDPSHAIVFVPSEFSPDTQLKVIRAIKRVLIDPAVGKVLHNGLYDQFCLSWHWGCPIINLSWDTMLSAWELYPEIKKSLRTQLSIFTNEPAYKYHKKSKNQRLFLEYNARDSAATLELCHAHRSKMLPDQLEHFDFNMQLLPIAAYMTRRGTLYDRAGQSAMHAEVTQQMQQKQAALELITGSYVNINSPKQLKDLLYSRFGFEPQYEVKNGRKTDKLVTDRKALLKLAKKFDHPLIPLILEWKHLEGKRKQLEFTPDKDGRVRGMYNVVGTETGRFSCSISEKEKADTRYPGGVPMHVINKAHRYLYLADPGYEYFQCDLEGADGWTVAAHCQRLGNPTMMEDYLAGNKPAKILAAMYLFQNKKIPDNPSKLAPTELSAYIKTLTIPEWLYFACKRVQHGTNYLLGVPTMIVQIMEDSYKIMGTPIHVSHRDAELLQVLYIQRYPGVRSWQDYIKTLVEKTGKLPSASGHIRTFFGRHGNELQREAVAHEPQANTTYATNLAAIRLWNDPENRSPDGHNLIIQPLHQVHDALNGQYPSSLRSWAHAKIRSYFDNEILIAGYRIRIPFDGRYGSSWGDTTHAFSKTGEVD